MSILGLNAYHGDVSAALIETGRVPAALEEERFRRVKHWAGFPAAALTAALQLSDVDDGGPTITRVFTSRLEKLLGPARHPEDPIEARHDDIAASLRAVFEAAFHVLNALYERTRNPSLCLAGGCAMNSVMNGTIRERTTLTGSLTSTKMS